MIRKWIKKYLKNIIIEVLNEEKVNITNNIDLRVLELLKSIQDDPQ